MFLRSDATSSSTDDDDVLRRTPTTMHVVEDVAQRIQCVALGGYPAPSIQVYVGGRDVTDRFRFQNGAALTGAVRGMRRVDYRSERSTENFRARADDDRELLRCEVGAPGTTRIVEFVRLDVDCESAFSTSLHAELLPTALLFIASSAEAVANYCNERVCVYVCVCV